MNLHELAYFLLCNKRIDSYKRKVLFRDTANTYSNGDAIIKIEPARPYWLIQTSTSFLVIQGL